MACDKSFSSNYMLLEPEKVELFDLIRMLFSSDLEKRKFIDCPAGTKEPFSRRWFIFASIVGQKLLQSTSKPMAGFGSAIEYWLNLISSNGNFGRLLLNFVQGKVVVPDKTAATFVSFNGNLDTRLELDPNVDYKDCRYHSALSVMAAKVSYENKPFIQNVVNDYWKMDFLGFYDFYNDYQGKNTTQAFMFQDKNVESELVVLSFRGTEPFDADAWSTDVDISWYELPCVGKVHGGFMKALGLQRNLGWPKDIDQSDDQPSVLAYYAIRKMLREILEQNDKKRFIVTGHSLGGALAILFPAILAMHEEEWLLQRLAGIYTYGQPRVGDEKFGEYMKQQLTKFNIQYFRFVYSNDLVPRLPYDDSTMMFKHFGSCVYFDSFYEGKIVDEEPNKNYFSPLYFFPKTTTATWEFFRSFIIPFTKGKDYAEGGLLRFFRVIGFLVVAGVPAHCPQDYVNATRLGSPDLFLVTDDSVGQKSKTN